MASLLIIQESLQNIKDLLFQQRQTASGIVREIEEIDEELSTKFATWKANLEQNEREAIEKTREMEDFYEKEMKSIEQAYQKSLQDDQKYIVRFLIDLRPFSLMKIKFTLCDVMRTNQYNPFKE